MPLRVFLSILPLILSFALQRILANDMPRLNFFDLLRESDKDFINRSGWQYNPSFTYAMIPDVQVLKPYRCLPRGGHGGPGGPRAGAGGTGSLSQLTIMAFKRA